MRLLTGSADRPATVLVSERIPLLVARTLDELSALAKIKPNALKSGRSL